LKQKIKLIELSKRPEIKLKELLKQMNEIIDNDYLEKNNKSDLLESIEIEIKYNGYIGRERLIADKVRRLEKIKIHENIDYLKIASISTEGRQKLDKIRPKTIGQAARIPGVSPSDINVLLVHIGR